MHGLSPFEHLLTPGLGVRVWIASSEGSTGGPCPYCSLPMHRPDGLPAEDGDPGLLVCRTCQEVWVPGGASEWMTANRAAGGNDPGPAAVVMPPNQCQNCGAPFEPDGDGRCAYCRAQIAAPAPVVVVLQPDPPAFRF